MKKTTSFRLYNVRRDLVNLYLAEDNMRIKKKVDRLIKRVTKIMEAK